jgi:beta-glucosidase
MIFSAKSLLRSSAIAAFAIACAACAEPVSPSEGQDGQSPSAERVGITVSNSTSSVTVHPEIWPEGRSGVERDPQIEAFIEDLLSRMTVEEKVGQILQADIGSITPELAAEYNIGSILNGGNSAPGGDNYAPPQAWVDLADAYYEASTDTSDGGVGIPILWGTDAVHGHSNVVGATLFPHNIGLGAANNPDLMRQIGEATALEIRATGQDWTFAPTVAVVQNDTWGRTYESYSETPEIVARLSEQIVLGLQGDPNSPDFLGPDHTIATTKHFVGDGGTHRGIDQGDTRVTEEVMRDIHAPAYPPSIAAGVQTAMASFNSWNGIKMHGNRAMLHDVLVERMGLDGFVVGDWEGHGQIEGCTNENCPQALLAGLDMYMASGSWQGLYTNLLAQVEDGTIPMARLDEAVLRILRVKARAGLFNGVRPSERPHAGNFDLIGSEAHRAIARSAVRQSLVLLKNNGGLLPLDPGQTILIAGDGADNIAKQAGGWTINWQGDGHTNDDFPQGQSVYDGFVDAVAEAGGTVILSEDGNTEVRPDVAVVVFGEEPYAEFVGDRDNLVFADERGLDLLRQFKADGIPTVAVFITGRPMWMNRELNASDAFVAAWLPGSEGGGIADVLVADGDGEPRHDFSGRLTFSWPQLATQTVLNPHDENYDPLFAHGFGLTYQDDVELGELSEDSGVSMADAEMTFELMARGRSEAPFALTLVEAGQVQTVTGPDGSSARGAVSATLDDRNVQDDSRRIVWSGQGDLQIAAASVDLGDAQSMAMSFVYQVTAAGDGATEFWVGCGDGCEGRLDMTQSIQIDAGKGWRTAEIPLSCFAEAGADLSDVDVALGISGTQGLEIWFADIFIAEASSDGLGCEL